MQCARKRLRCSWMLARSYLPRFRDMYRMLQNPTMSKQKDISESPMISKSRSWQSNYNINLSDSLSPLFIYLSIYLDNDIISCSEKAFHTLICACTIQSSLIQRISETLTILHANFVSTKNRPSSEFSYLHPFNRLSWKPLLSRCFAWDNLFYIWVINLRRIRAENRLLRPAFLTDYP